MNNIDLAHAFFEAFTQPAIVKIWLVVIAGSFALIFLQALGQRMARKVAKKYQGKHLSDSHLLILFLFSLAIAVAFWFAL